MYKANVHTPGLWIPKLQRKGETYVMNMAHAAGFSAGDQILPREAATILKVNTTSNIANLDGNKIKKGVVGGVLDDRISCYR